MPSKIVLLSPNQTPRSRAALRDRYQSKATSPVYASVLEQYLDIADFVADLMSVISEQVSDIGTRSLEAHNLTEPEILGSLVGQDLSDAGIDLLVLDEADQLNQLSWLSEFFMGMIASAENLTIVVSGRELWQETWERAIRVGDAFVEGGNLYRIENASANTLTIKGFGPRGGIAANEHTISPKSFEGPLTLNLFYLFVFGLVQKGSLTRDEIFAALWPDLPVKEATNVFHVTKRKVATILGFELTEYSHGFYSLSPSVVLTTDVGEFLARYQEAQTAGESEDAMALWEAANHLYTRAFLSAIDLPVFNTWREDFQSKSIDTLVALGRIRMARETQEDDKVALATFNRVLRDLPREDVLRRLMELYVRLGKPQDGKTLYQSFVDRIYPTKPHRTTVAKYVELFGEEPGAKRK